MLYSYKQVPRKRKQAVLSPQDPSLRMWESGVRSQTSLKATLKYLSSCLRYSRQVEYVHWLETGHRLVCMRLQSYAARRIAFGLCRDAQYTQCRHHTGPSPFQFAVPDSCEIILRHIAHSVLLVVTVPVGFALVNLNHCQHLPCTIP